MPIRHKYPLPPCFTGIMTVSEYDKLLNCKADSLRTRDDRLKRPFPGTFTKAGYKQEIHAAFMRCNGKDPYTGDALRFDLIGGWNKKKETLLCSGRCGALFNKELFLMPTVDHCDPYGSVLHFEICSWIVNTSKSLMNPQEYVALCKKVAGNTPM